ncbi:ExbD/TolR family protein [Selenihalanaerobacter shriftii]|uniref:Outer membrane transport energization protein ExbD (TC 2.C.1.1.1) n=1 Tax=Selenihalanaerobacter shriftii TaxID=142842 RepID=A0A1T4JLW4_9FIRM|nr:biopolymer transporter ExbD [Selenihalanaerobacter shriftii]SJZ31123.1 outer membrane transport energization protein ExbD (TC 2.C.1.1.1) [Selenihalanaerobacter shriftii]
MFQRGTKKKINIQILPMIDVIFFLLVFFMLFTTFKTTPTGLNINLPKAKTVTKQQQQQLIVNLSSKGHIYLNNELLTKPDLKDKVAAKIKNNPKTVVIIKADKKVVYNKIVEVMDTVRQVGAYKIALAAENAEKNIK